MGIEAMDLGSVKWVPVIVARKALRVSRQRIYQLLKSGRLAGIRVDGQLMISSVSIRDRMAKMATDWRESHGSR